MLRNVLAVLLSAFGGALPVAGEPPATPVHAIVFVDLIPAEKASGSLVLNDYVRRARRDPAVQSVVMIEQDSIPNHFILEETFVDRASYQRFTAQDYVRRFRSALFPHLGSPWDERLGGVTPIEIPKKP